MRWTAQPRQAAFLLADEYAVLFGGARGGGKTDALLVHGIAVAQEHPRANVLFLRRNFAELAQPGAAIPRSEELLAGHASWNAGDHRWTLRNGSTLKFGHLSDSAAIQQYLGTQVDALLLDQAEQLTEDEYRRLQGSVRSTVAGLAPHVRLTANPGGPGHAWLKARFIDAAEPDTRYEIDGQTHRFVPSRVFDNPALLARDPDYVRRLQLLGGKLASAWLDGDWDLPQEGLAFAEWRRQTHVCEPFAVPADWPRWLAVDYGYHSPFCALWLTRSPAGTIYAYRELYGALLLDRDQALQIRTLSAGETFRRRVGDPSMWTAKHNGYAIVSPAASYAEMAVPLEPASNDRLVGKSRVHEVLAWADGAPPQLQVFTTCANLIRTLPALVLDERKPEDVDTDGEDHAYDALKYGLLAMALPTPRTRHLQFGR
ncbi:MAG: terminase family protein [Acidobacteria bacterium]|nr:terminase family protein [Acidobacteriota bacterium]